MKLSVITVTYKDAHGLGETLHSLKGIENSDIQWEHLIVDSSPEVNQALLAELPRTWPLRHLIVPPEGVYAAMNSGIAKASGDILWFLNGGDTLLVAKELLRYTEELLADSDHEMICAGARLVRNGEDLYAKLPNSNFLKNILIRNQLSHQAVLYKNSIFQKVGNFSLQYKIAADYQHYFRCYAANIRVRCEPICLVTCDLSGISSVRWRDSLREAARISLELRRQLPFSIYWRHQLFCRLEFFRVWAIKLARKHFGDTALKSIWLWWNRNF